MATVAAPGRLALSLLAVMALVVPLTPGQADAAGSGRPGKDVCTGGLVKTGVYPDLLVAGSCAAAPGAMIRVLGNLTLGVDAAFADSSGRLEVDGDLDMPSDSSLVFGGADFRLLILGSLHVSTGLGPHRPAVHQDVTAASNRLLIVTPHPDYWVADIQEISIVSDSLGTGGGTARPDASGGLQTIEVTGVRVGRSVVIKDDDVRTVDISADYIGRDLVVDGDDTHRADLSGDRVGGSIDCSGDDPAPTDGNSADPDHARDGLHGQCHDL